MLELLLNPGRIASKFGKWRWALYFAAGVVSWVVGWALIKILTVAQQMSPSTNAAEFQLWVLGISSVIALAFMMYGVWLYYVDETRESYKHRADEYRKQGW